MYSFKRSNRYHNMVTKIDTSQLKKEKKQERNNNKRAIKKNLKNNNFSPLMKTIYRLTI